MSDTGTRRRTFAIAGVFGLALAVPTGWADSHQPTPTDPGRLTRPASGETLRRELAELSESYERAFAANDVDKVEELAIRRLEIALALGEPLEAARAQTALGGVRRRQGRLDEARELLDLALTELRQGGDPRTLARALTSRANLHRSRGEYYESLDLETESLAIRTSLAPPERPHISLSHMGALYEQLEDFDRAIEALHQAVAASQQDANPGAEASTRTRLAGLLNDIRADEPHLARAHAETALAIQERLDNRPGMLDARFHVARAALNAGEFALAERLLDQAFEEALVLRQRASQAHIQFRRAELHFRRGDPARARAVMEDAIARYRELGNRHRLAKAHGLLADMAAAQRDTMGELRARLEHYRLRDELLGAGATRRVNDLIERLRRSSEQARVAMLERDNRIQQLQLDKRRTSARLNISLLAMAVLVALVLAWRYRHVTASNRILDEQRQALSHANTRLAEQSEDLRRLANEDGLTGLPNRTCGLRHLNEELQRATEGSLDVGVLILDIDLFKGINDRFGHLAGDEVLRQTARVMQEVFSTQGHVARLGGEEFLGVLPGGERLTDFAECIRALLAKRTIDADGRQIHVTASIGLVRLAQMPGASMSDLLRAADQALYAAKRSGRNRVVAWPEVGDDEVVEFAAG